MSVSGRDHRKGNIAFTRTFLLFAAVFLFAILMVFFTKGGDIIQKYRTPKKVV
jgi:hypothetical protein